MLVGERLAWKLQWRHPAEVVQPYQRAARIRAQVFVSDEQLAVVRKLPGHRTNRELVLLPRFSGVAQARAAPACRSGVRARVSHKHDNAKIERRTGEQAGEAHGTF